MLKAQDREELMQMRDAIAERIHYYDEHVNYGTLSLEDKHNALSQEFGPDYRETLCSMNQLLHEKPRSHHINPHSHLTLVIVFLAVVMLGALALSTTHPSLTGQTINTQLIVSEQSPAQLSWSESTTINSLTVDYAGTGQLVVQDARGEHVLVDVQEGYATCTGCPLTVHPPVLLELFGEGELVVTSLTTRQKP